MTPHYEPMSVLEAAFLGIEDAAEPMHVALTAVFGPGPLVLPSGQLDMGRVRRYVLAFLNRLPEWHQRVMRVPLLRRPVWVDDPFFDVDHHVRRVRLPAPGETAELKELVGRLYSTRLPRDRPLWEAWFVEGAAGGGFAVVLKAHHCMLDGVAGIAALAAILSASPETDLEPALAWRPRPVPRRFELLRAELARRSAEPGELWRRARAAARGPARVVDAARAALAGVESIAKLALAPASRTPLNPRRVVGPERRFEWTALELERVRNVKHAAGCKVNDVVLATAAGAFRSFLLRRGVAVDRLDFRALVPVSTHAPGESGFHNRVSAMLARLPVGEPDARTRLERIMRDVGQAKTAHQSYVAELGQAFGEWTSSALVVAAVRGVFRLRPYNVIVTDIAGPAQPLYLMGSELTDVFPMVPLYGNQALGVALVSYNGRLFWGFNADRELVPDVALLPRDVEQAFDELDAAYAPERVAHESPRVRV